MSVEPVQSVPPADPRKAAANLKMLVGLTAVAGMLADTAFLYSPTPELLGLIILCAFGFFVALLVWRSIWIRHCWTNAELLAPGTLRDGRTRAVGLWFVPLVNLWWPRRVLLDLRRASGLPQPGVVNLWWATGLVGLVVDLVGGAYLRHAHWALLGLCAVILLRAVVYIRLIAQLTDRQAQALALPAIHRPGDPLPKAVPETVPESAT
ncbi:hypothetical protein ABH931_001255 [Streptacidiphilus sp. MAP12-33]|uniref:DUF4328 domain-containing protein n=1 Tax=Streptacidiphilus sp. MAP12-33 TaxID=3156266 RepID=UPI0035160F61